MSLLGLLLCFTTLVRAASSCAGNAVPAPVSSPSALASSVPALVFPVPASLQQEQGRQQDEGAQEGGEQQRAYPVPEDLRALMQESMLVDFTDWLKGRAEEQGVRPPRVRHGGRALDLGGVGKVLLWAGPEQVPMVLGMELPRRRQAPSEEPAVADLEGNSEWVAGFVRQTGSGEVVFQTDEARLSLPELDSLRAATLARAPLTRWDLRCGWPTPMAAVAAVMDALYDRGRGSWKIAHQNRLMDERDRGHLALLAPELEPDRLPRFEDPARPRGGQARPTLVEGEVLLVLGSDLPYADLSFLLRVFAARGFTALSLAVVGPDGGWGKIPLWIPVADEMEEPMEEPMELPADDVDREVEEEAQEEGEGGGGIR